MKERLFVIANDIASLSSATAPSQQNTSADSIDDFLQSVEATTSQPKQSKLKESDMKRIGTFHSIFLKILKEDIEKLGMKYTKNFGIFDTNESQTLLKDVLKKLNLQETFKVAEAKNFISTQKNNGLDPQACIKTIKTDYDQSMYKVYEQYQKALEQANSLDFDDLLLLPYLIFKKDKETLQKRTNKFTYILVDEAQDTNRIQFELMKMLSGDEGNITLIGDDFQSIYGWR